MNFRSGEEAPALLSLDRIRSTLIRLEDTIIFSLIERAQFAQCPGMYEPGAFPELKEMGFQGSWLDWFLHEIETFHAKARRYQSPDEHPFTEGLPLPILNPLEYPSLLHDPSKINVNPQIKAYYIDKVVPKITKGLGIEDDGNYGSAATRDVEVLQAVSRRIHFGMFVSESKFLSAPSDFIPHILNPNPDALAGLITKPEVERKLLVRLGNKVRIYGQDLDGEGKPLPEDQKTMKGKLDVDEVVRLYEGFVIPLTKDVEVDYLLHRLDGVPQSQIDEWMRK